MYSSRSSIITSKNKKKLFGTMKTLTNSFYLNQNGDSSNIYNSDHYNNSHRYSSTLCYGKKENTFLSINTESSSSRGRKEEILNNKYALLGAKQQQSPFSITTTSFSSSSSSDIIPNHTREKKKKDLIDELLDDKNTNIPTTPLQKYTMNDGNLHPVVNI